MSPEQEFAQALHEAGLIVEGLPIMNGEIQRVRVEGGKQNKKSGAGSLVTTSFITGEL